MEIKLLRGMYLENYDKILELLGTENWRDYMKPEHLNLVGTV